jgi:hypothetical protein
VLVLGTDRSREGEIKKLMPWSLGAVITKNSSLAYLGKVSNWIHVISDKELSLFLFEHTRAEHFAQGRCTAPHRSGTNDFPIMQEYSYCALHLPYTGSFLMPIPSSAQDTLGGGTSSTQISTLLNATNDALYISYINKGRSYGALAA